MGRAEYLSADEKAGPIVRALRAAAPSGLSIMPLVAASGLTYSQVYKGLAILQKRGRVVREIRRVRSKAQYRLVPRPADR